MKKNLLLSLSILAFLLNANAQIKHPALKTKSDSKKIKIELIKKIHNSNHSDLKNITKDVDIHSPKSVNFHIKGNKFYVHSLEGFKTIVYDSKTFKKKSTIHHHFNKKNDSLFQEESCLNYEFIQEHKSINTFNGKPVESCFSHQQRYLWVSYYRRSYDPYAVEPSAIAIIDTKTDKIVRVMPCGPIPKMIACSPDNKYIAVTHWGDNTVALIDISSDSVKDFKYAKHLVVGHQQKYSKKDTKVIKNRDAGCGFCLRGTAFTKDSKYLLIGRMGGGGITIFDMEDFSLVNTIYGMKTNLRHIVITDKNLYLSSNRTGYVQKTPIDSLIQFALNSKTNKYTKWSQCYAGAGCRTIVVSLDEKYIFAASNNTSTIVIIDALSMKVLNKISADSYPVGLAYNDKEKILISTSQGKSGNGGNCVDIYKLVFKKAANTED